MHLTSLMVLSATVIGLGTLASAEPAIGTWQTQPDKKGQIAHVQVTKCDAALCGEIVRTYDSDGDRITTENVGKRVFWDVTPTGDGEYRGRAWVPAHDRVYAARMDLKGKDRLKVSGCLGPICQSQLWARVE
ncbi:DUF2147 domain-containing protein [Roseovarius sp. D22-M7]|uniref:DUF2147 domain-containing protein n=1 Tax=Roseovarius sp. D22-M7 TaxID=3127116 RepID=UPI0030105277